MCVCRPGGLGGRTGLCSVGGACLGGVGGCFGLLFVCECVVTFSLQELFFLIRMSSDIESDVNILLVV